MEDKTETGSAEEQPARDISSGDEVIRFSAPVYPEFLLMSLHALENLCLVHVHLPFFVIVFPSSFEFSRCVICL